MASFDVRTWHRRLPFYFIASCLGIKVLSSNECWMGFEVEVHESLNQAYLSKGCRLGALHLRGVLFQRNIDQIHHTYSRHVKGVHSFNNSWHCDIFCSLCEPRSQCWDQMPSFLADTKSLMSEKSCLVILTEKLFMQGGNRSHISQQAALLALLDKPLHVKMKYYNGIWCDPTHQPWHWGRFAVHLHWSWSFLVFLEEFSFVQPEQEQGFLWWFDVQNGPFAIDIGIMDVKY